MASIRKRTPWRVVIDGKDDAQGPFISSKQAEARKATLVAQGIDEKSIKVVQANWASIILTAMRRTRYLDAALVSDLSGPRPAVTALAPGPLAIPLRSKQATPLAPLVTRFPIHAVIRPPNFIRHPHGLTHSGRLSLLKVCGQLSVHQGRSD